MILSIVSIKNIFYRQKIPTMADKKRYYSFGFLAGEYY